jgi:hypothetical protein|tara:strand:+ start:122378 stop:122485 length:108 start_codon:yes stop_codon:yes gene_type:complete
MPAENRLKIITEFGHSFKNAVGALLTLTEDGESVE